MPKVSVIVPIYNVEEYIDRCAKSLFEQTLDDIEFVFVDDCSPDNSINKLKELIPLYPNRKEEVKIVRHSENRGLAIARRTGIENASGDYIIHCDSDDWMDRNMYADMYNEAISKQADIVICGYLITDGITFRPYVSCRSTQNMKLIENCLLQKESAALWSKMVKRKLYQNKLAFPQYSMGEDITLCLQLFFYAHKIVFLPKPYYFYFVNPKSITQSPSVSDVVRRFNEVSNNVSLLEQFFHSKQQIPHYVKEAFYCFKHIQRDLLKPIINEWSYYKLWRDSFKGLNRRVLLMPLSLKEKTLFVLRFLRLLKR